MSYRNDYDAARERAVAAEREAALLKKELEALKKTAPEARQRMERPIPQRFEVSHDGTDVSVRWRWFHAEHVMLLIFCAVWDGVLIAWYAQALRNGDAASIGFWLPLLHVTVGVCLTYSTIAGFINRTVVSTVGGHAVRVSHGPLPWRGNTVITRDEFRQLYVTETHHHDSDSNKTTYTYDLCAMMSNSREKKLVSGIKDRNEAAYLESALERALDIADVRVAGEAA